MLLVEEAIQSVQSQYSKGVQSKDSRLTDRHIYSALINARSTILKQAINKKQNVNSACYQPLNCIELETAPKGDCPCSPVTTTILRSKYELPRIINSLDAPVISYVTNIEGDKIFTRTEYKNVKYLVGNVYTANVPRYYIHNNRLYVTSVKILKAVSLGALLEDPKEGYDFPSICEECNNCKCYDIMQKDFRLDRDSLKGVLALAQQELVIMFGQMKEDKIPNATDDNTSSGDMVHQQRG